MSVSLYEITIPVFIKQLRTLERLLEKGVAHARDQANALTEEGLVHARLIADMKDLVFQGEISFLLLLGRERFWVRGERRGEGMVVVVFPIQELVDEVDGGLGTVCA